MKSILIASEAAGGADEIADHIALDNPARADSFLDEILERALHIAECTRSFRLRPEIGPRLRAAKHGAYLIVFEEQPGHVRVLRILHGARELRRVLRRNR